MFETFILCLHNMDALGSPTLTNLFFEVTNLIWIINDTFSSSLSDLEGPFWLRLLRTEIERLYFILEQAERYGLGNHQLEYGSTDENSAYLSGALSFLEGLKHGIMSFRNEEIQFEDILLVGEERCSRYIEVLSSCRTYVANALNQVHSYDATGLRNEHCLTCGLVRISEVRCL